jgi:hypothetical protein
MVSSKSPLEDKATELSGELSILSRQQYEALQDASYLNMSEREAEEYDKRRLRIGEICAFLVKFRTK